MPETVAAYKQRIQSHVAGKDPLASMAESAEQIKKVTQGLSDEVARRRPAPGKWSIVEIMAHLADGETVIGYRVRSILGSEDGVAIIGYDQDKWATGMNYHGQQLSSAVDAFVAARRRNLDLYRSLTPEQWEKFGIHSERGKESVRDTVTLCAGHDLNHLEQMRAILGKN